MILIRPRQLTSSKRYNLHGFCFGINELGTPQNRDHKIGWIAFDTHAIPRRSHKSKYNSLAGCFIYKHFFFCVLIFSVSLLISRNGNKLAL